MLAWCQGALRDDYTLADYHLALLPVSQSPFMGLGPVVCVRCFEVRESVRLDLAACA